MATQVTGDLGKGASERAAEDPSSQEMQVEAGNMNDSKNLTLKGAETWCGSQSGSRAGKLFLTRGLCLNVGVQV